MILFAVWVKCANILRTGSVCPRTPAVIGCQVTFDYCSAFDELISSAPFISVLCLAAVATFQELGWKWWEGESLGVSVNSLMSAVTNTCTVKVKFMPFCSS